MKINFKFKKKENAISKEDINYNVYNALNLVNEELGENYIETGFNPFEEGFELDESYVNEILKSQKEAEELASPQFITDGPDAALKAFEKSMAGSVNALAQLEALLNDPRVPMATKRKIQKIIEYIKMRIQLLEIEIKKLKKKESQNALEMYQQINALNWYYYKDFEESFLNENFDIMKYYEHLIDLTPESTNNPREVLSELREDIHEVLNELGLDREDRQEIRQEVREEIKDFIQDVRSGESVQERAVELFENVEEIIQDKVEENIQETSTPTSTSQPRVREDEGMSR